MRDTPHALRRRAALLPPKDAVSGNSRGWRRCRRRRPRRRRRIFRGLFRCPRAFNGRVPDLEARLGLGSARVRRSRGVRLLPRPRPFPSLARVAPFPSRSKARLQGLESRDVFRRPFSLRRPRNRRRGAIRPVDGAISLGERVAWRWQGRRTPRRRRRRVPFDIGPSHAAVAAVHSGDDGGRRRRGA